MRKLDINWFWVAIAIIAVVAAPIASTVTKYNENRTIQQCIESNGVPTIVGGALSECKRAKQL